MSKKILFIATVDGHFTSFHLDTFSWLRSSGWEVHVASLGQKQIPHCDKQFAIPISRNPLHLNNIKAYTELKKIITASNYQIIHCHTPVGGLVGRLAAHQARQRGSKIIYTAHGFHFYRGAPLINWIFYYPIERILAHLTDTLITITQEDHNLCKRHKFRSNAHIYQAGVGVDCCKFSPSNSHQQSITRSRLGFKETEILLLYAAELNKNKNQQLLIHALRATNRNDIHLLLAGTGPEGPTLKALARQLKIESNVHFLGFRNDLAEVTPACDIAVASSQREGLPVNVMEAMACGIPVIATNNRGHRELIEDGVTGIIVPNNATIFAAAIIHLANNPHDRKQYGMAARDRIQNQFSTQQTKSVLEPLYNQHLGKNSHQP